MNERATLPPRSERTVRSLSPEARRERAIRLRTQLAAGHGEPDGKDDRPGLVQRVSSALRPGTRAFEVAKRVAVGTYTDGMMYAGNLAYLSMVSIFPFFIIGAALFELIGGEVETANLIATVLASMPPTVSEAIGPVANDVIQLREGWLLWLGAGVALWTVSSLIETIREILRRAYGTKASHAFWKYRLFSAGLILSAVVLLILSLIAQVAIGTAQQVILAGFPQLSEAIGFLRLSRIAPAFGLTLSIYLLFYTLTPAPYRAKGYPKWPGALFTAGWWIAVTTALPLILTRFLAYDLTYGSLAGIIVALFFFWLVGLGVVVGAELNAALAEPEEEDESVAVAAEEVQPGTVQTGAQVGSRTMPHTGS